MYQTTCMYFKEIEKKTQNVNKSFFKFDELILTEKSMIPIKII